MRPFLFLSATLWALVALSPAQAEPAAAPNGAAAPQAHMGPPMPAAAEASRPSGTTTPAMATPHSKFQSEINISGGSSAPGPLVNTKPATDAMPAVAPTAAKQSDAEKSAAPAAPAATAATASKAGGDDRHAGAPETAASERAAATEAAVETVAAAPVTQPAPPSPPEPTLSIDINLTTQRMTVTDNGAAKYTWPISSAAAGYKTPTGTYKPVWMSRMWYSRQYDNSPMPHSIFFHKGVAIHATQAIRHLGAPASHGCVRLAPSNAAKLYKLVSNHGKARTKIVVHGTPRYRATVSYQGNRVRSGQQARRRTPGAYTYYGRAPSYYRPNTARAASRGAPPPRRYVSRGLFQSGN